MSEYDDAATVRSLSTNDSDKLKNTQVTLATLINESRNNEPSNSVLLQELRSVKGSTGEVTALKN